MKISFEAPDEWEALLDEEAQKDGHSNRAAVIRKIVNLFFADKLQFSSDSAKENEDSGANMDEVGNGK